MRAWMDDWGTGRWALWLSLWTFGVLLLLLGGSASGDHEAVMRGWGALSIVATTVLLRGVGWQRRLLYLTVVWGVAIALAMIFDGLTALLVPAS